MAPSYQTNANKRKHAQGTPVRNHKILVQTAAVYRTFAPSLISAKRRRTKSVRNKIEFLTFAAANDLVPGPLSLVIDRRKFTWTHWNFISKRQVLLQEKDLLPVLLLHDLGAQIADSVDNARKRGAHLGLEVAIVEAALLKCMLSPFDA